MKIKFVTLNIWSGGKLFGNVVDFIRKESPDIIVMQEVYDGKSPRLERKFRTIEVFKKKLGFPHYIFAPAFIDTLSVGNIEQGNVMFSKFPIISEKVTFFDKPYGKFSSEDPKDFGLIPPILHHGLIGFDNLKLNIFNIHGIWGIDGKDNNRRLKMSEKIVRETKDKENVILAGDFNVELNTQTIKNIERYLKNVFKDELKTTFNMKHKDKDGYATSVVDMIFVSKHFKAANRYMPDVDVSDHMPLVCELEI